MILIVCLSNFCNIVLKGFENSVTVGQSQKYSTNKNQAFLGAVACTVDYTRTEDIDCFLEFEGQEFVFHERIQYA